MKENIKLKQLQKILRNRGRITRDNLYDIARELRCDFDTARRYLETDRTPFSKKATIGNKTLFWDYVEELDPKEQTTMNI